MAIRIDRPGAAPSWLEGILASIDRLLNRVFREKVGRLRVDFDTSHAGQTLSLGALPANAIINPAMSGVTVTEAFNAGTDNRIDIGTAADADLYGTDISLASLGFKPLDESAVSFRPSETDATELRFAVDLTGTAATTGKGAVVIVYTLL